VPLCPVHQTDTVRLVPTAYYKPPVLKPLIDTEEELEILSAFEGLTNQRLLVEASGLGDLEARELLFYAYGQTYVNAAFSYTRPEGNRFNDAARGAWYCAYDDLTAIEEVAYHRTRELERIQVFQDMAEYQVLLAAFIGEFHDVRGFDKSTDFLGPDPMIAYRAGQKLAQSLRREQSRGIVYPSVRKVGGICLVAFQPHLVQNVRPGARWQLSWSGSAQFTARAV
jgi:RES domain-containing protein